MNTQINQPTTNPLREEQMSIAQMAQEIMSLSYNKLLQKYSFKILSEKILTYRPVSYRNVVDYLQVQEHLFITQLLPADQNQNIPLNSKIKEQIVNLLSSADDTRETIDQKLKQIDPRLNLPANLALEEIKIAAGAIRRGLDNIKNIMADLLVPEYINDLRIMLRFSPGQFNEISQEITEISAELEKQYNNFERYMPIDETIYQRIGQFLLKVGRTQVFVENFFENPNLGEISDLILKINYALSAANALKNKNTQIPTTDQEMRDYLKFYLKQSLVV